MARDDQCIFFCNSQSAILILIPYFSWFRPSLFPTPCQIQGADVKDDCHEERQICFFNARNQVNNTQHVIIVQILRSKTSLSTENFKVSTVPSSSLFSKMAEAGSFSEKKKSAYTFAMPEPRPPVGCLAPSVCVRNSKDSCELKPKATCEPSAFVSHLHLKNPSRKDGEVHLKCQQPIHGMVITRGVFWTL